MSFLISKCCNETISSVFDRCFSKNLHFYYELCKIGIELGCAVAHHKFAALLIHNINQDENDTFQKCKEARDHLEISMKLGFHFSCFLLSRLLH